MDNLGESVKTVTAMEARKNFGTILEEVHYKGERFVIARAGKPMAAVVPLSQLEELQIYSGAAKPGHDTSKGNKRRSHKG